MTSVPRPVKRTYDGATRRATSDETRRRILATARELLIERGYRATTIAAISAGAEVNPDTVYELVGRKPMIVRELVEQALSGTDHAVPAADRTYVAEIRAAPHPAGKIRIYAAATVAMLGRLAPLVVALREAGAGDAEAAELWRQFGDRRAANMRLFVAELGARREGVSLDDAADTVWATNSPELYLLLTGERGWAPERYERWLVDTWSRLLLPDVAPGRPATARS